jgi:pyrimidine deaminase RibD-like protein
MVERYLMEMAINMARKCESDNPDRIPLVGALIEHNGEILGKGCRGEDIHAEMDALSQVRDRTRLQDATIYTTLEPCTPGVRSKPEESCTSLIRDARVKKVVIGILDPNQGVCGKGLLELQRHGIEVELFPQDLAQKIRLLNDRFVRAQQTLGVHFLDPEPNAQLHTYRTNGKHTFTCECITPPGPDVFILFTNPSGQWWPQPTRLRQKSDSNKYEFDCWFGTTGFHTIHVVRATELGSGLINYYRKVVDLGTKQLERLKPIGLSEDRLRQLRLGYPGIELTRLPRGLDSQANIVVEVMPKAG